MFQHRIEDGEELAHAGGEGDLHHRSFDGFQGRGRFRRRNVMAIQSSHLSTFE
jgi:hypothetical protein